MCKVYGAGQIRDKIPTTYTYRVDRGIEGGGGCVKKGKTGQAGRKRKYLSYLSAPVILGLGQHCDAHG